MTPLAFAGLALPVLLGVVVGWVRLFDRPEMAIGHLNRYALYLAFPALIVAGLTDARFALPGQMGFWAVVPVAMLLTVGLIWLASRSHPEQSGSLALAGIFGNVAYVGLPLCVSVLGDQALGTTSLAVSLFVLCSLVLGPTLLVRWTPGAVAEGSPWRAVLRQPLFWSPFVGLGLRALPEAAVAAVNGLLGPIGSSAAPVALFLLGLYLWENRGQVTASGAAGGAHVLVKMLLFPAVLVGLVLGARAMGWKDGEAARIVLLLGATPTAIAAFALSVEFGVGRERVAQAIVGSTLVAAVSLPLVAAGVVWLVP